MLGVQNRNVQASTWLLNTNMSVRSITDLTIQFRRLASLCWKQTVLSLRPLNCRVRHQLRAEAYGVVRNGREYFTTAMLWLPEICVMDCSPVKLMYNNGTASPPPPTSSPSARLAARPAQALVHLGVQFLQISLHDGMPTGNWKGKFGNSHLSQQFP